jgi:hypothetical protein
MNSENFIFRTLEKLHIFVLAHILRRPIIVYAHPKLEVFNSLQSSVMLSNDERVDGIYLPLLWPKEVCRKDPLALSYHSSHFAALVPSIPSTPFDIHGDDQSMMKIEGEVLSLFPLSSQNRNSGDDDLLIHFLSNEQTMMPKVEILNEWMRVEKTKKSSILVALQTATPSSALTHDLLSSFISTAKLQAEQMASAHALNPQTPQLCIGGCGFTGSPATHGMLLTNP